MEAGSSLEVNSGFSRFACDFCRQKKLKCSRELPKCSTCKPWPGGCEYSRDKPAHFVEAISHNLDVETEASPPQPAAQPSQVEDRLNHLEQEVRRLTESVEQALRAIHMASPKRNAVRQPSLPDPTVASPRDSSSPGLYIGTSHSFSFLREAPAIIEKTASQHSGATARKSALSGLQSLSTQLTIAQIDQTARGARGYYVPSRPAGYHLVSQFLEQAEMGGPFFHVPPEDTVRQAIFEPQSVQEKAWVVCINYMLLSAGSAEHNEGKEADKLRHKMQLALNDSRIFLEPSEANVQALTLLAMHGEDYAAPNLSWMLLGHACRQAQALGLHEPAHRGFESWQQGLCFFWLLFMVDKSCSLAFGRPAFLPMASYPNVPLPDDSYLLKFHPHQSTAFGNQQPQSQVSTFGAIFLCRCIELAKLIGCILDALTTSEASLVKQNIRSKLEAWYEDTNQILLETMRVESASANADQVREMALGINSFRFQYLHVLIVLLKGEESSSSLRVSSAREAISLLPSMVSNWNSVYNGVVWHLLYYPFIPFFVVFENIIQRHGSSMPSVKQDLGLLSTTVDYFARMRSQMRVLATVCSRLQHVAAVFLHLAQVHVGHYSSNETHISPAGSSQTSTTGRTKRSHGRKFRDQAKSDAAHSYSRAHEGPMDVDLGELDATCFLEWMPSDIDVSCPMLESHRQNFDTLDAIGGSSNPENSRNSRRTAPDSTFDWFSWDAYYSGTEPNSSFE